MIRAWLSIALMALLAACSTPQQGETEVRLGKVTRIEAVTIDGDHQLGLGAIIGAVAGGVLGYQIRNGTGRDVATVAGTLLGAYGGNKVQNHYASPRPGQHVLVLLDNGVSVGITQPVNSALAVGDRVRVEGVGQDARVMRY